MLKGALEVEEYQGYKVGLYLDEVCSEPDWDFAGEVIRNPRYGNYYDTTTEEELIARAKEDYGPGDWAGVWDDRGELWAILYLSDTKARKEYGLKRLSAKARQRAGELLKGESNAWQAWVRGEVYGWTLESPEGELLESVWGYYGEPRYALSEGIKVAKGYIQQEIKNHKAPIMAC